jgi:hypothetical protein
MSIQVKDLASAADVRELTVVEMADIKGGWLQALAAGIAVFEFVDKQSGGALSAPINVNALLTPPKKKPA